MISVLLFLGVLSILVIIHEIGHYVAARVFGVKAEEFGYGFPPRLLGFVKVDGKWKRVGTRDRNAYANTIWSLNWLPLGGFVRLKGEQGEQAKDHDSFLAKRAFPRIIILAAGVMINWVLAASIFIIAFIVGVPIQTDGLPAYAMIRDERVQIVQVLRNSAAANSGLEVGDFIISINGVSVLKANDAHLAIQTASTGEFIRLIFERSGNRKTINVQPEFVSSIQRPGLGIAMASTGITRFTWYRAIEHGVIVTWQYTKMIVFGLGGLIRDLVTAGRVTQDVAGPVGIAVMTGTIAKQGIWALAQFTALLSLNLAVINFLPIPALDGGRAFFVFVESIRRRRTHERFELITHQIGFVFLLILIAIVTIHDLRHYGGVIWGGVKGLFY